LAPWVWELAWLSGAIIKLWSGLSIIFTRPFVVGDTVRILGVFGVVREVHLAFSLLTNAD